MAKYLQPRKENESVKPIVYTKKRMSEAFLFRTTLRDAEMLTAAAMRQEISRSDFIRRAVKEKVARVLERETVE